MAAHPKHVAFVALSLLVWLPAALRAQVLPPTPDTTEVLSRFGPLWVNPTISLTDGMDTNLFNDAQAEQPRRAFSMLLTPQTDVWMRAGRTWVTGSVRQDLIWFHDYQDEGAVNGRYLTGWVVPLTRLSFGVNGSWVRAKERPNFEIDTRANRREAAINGAAEYRVRSRTLVGARVERRSIRFSSGSFFERQDLHERLSRVRTLGALTVRHELTPITSLTADVASYRDRFVVSSSRDADSVHGNLGVRIDPAGVISGSAQVGYRRLTPASPDVPAYRGMTILANVSAVTPVSSKLAVQVVRDLEYSFEERQPYYLLTGVAASVVQRVRGSLEATGSVGFRSLSYQDHLSVNAPGLPRLDHVVTFGGGPSLRLGKRSRLWFDVERQARTSQLAERRYRGLRYSVTMTYGSSGGRPGER